MKVRVDVGKFPSAARRIVLDWYRWQEAYVRVMGKQLGGPPIPMATPEYSFWLATPPFMERGELRLGIGGMHHYVIETAEGWRLDQAERNDRRPVVELRNFPDMEKFLLCLMGEAAYKGDYTQAPYYRWYEQGVAPGVTLQPVDPQNEYSPVYLIVEGEPQGSTRQSEAISFSHPLLMTYEEIETLYRSKIPSEMFTIDVVPIDD
ncbi:hypothetical protein AB0N05_06925 [Nocardia sp. NPDC051030]|uniref:hypothetical protein n=1 Tax=Nocardia sp. NPDC051030 TaxID=3155162 RepID=UPI003446915A